MDAITRIKIQKQPKKDFLGETKAVVEEAMQQPQTAPVTPQTTNVHAVEQTPAPTPKVAEKPLNQSELQAVNNPTPEQINTNNLIAGAKPSPGVPDNYVVPSPVEFGAKYDSAQMQKDIADPTKGYFYVMQQLNKESAYEGQEEIDKREKREKQRNLITSIADGLSSIANIGGTLAGGVNQKQTSLSEANTKRREYQRQLRERDREKWQQMMMRTGEQQQNYELAKDRQALMNSIQEDKMYIKGLELELKNAKTQVDISNAQSAIEARQRNIELNWAKLEEAKRNNTVNQGIKQQNANASTTRAGASVTSAGASQQRANDNSIKTQKEIEMRANGTWNQSTAGKGAPQSKYTPTTQPTTTRQPEKKKAVTQSKGKYDF